MNKLEIDAWTLSFLGLPILAGILGHFIIYNLLMAFIRDPSVRLFVKYCYRTLQWIAVVFIVRLILPLAAPPDLLAVGQQTISILFIALVSLLIVRGLYGLEEYVLIRFRIDAQDNLRARKIYTQFNVVKQIVIVAVSFLALGMMLMTFEKVRQLGTTILASAGIIGIVVGMAAQRTIGAFIAGLQIAFTQPIRIDDVVIIENEWGRIEEITLTYVVVRIWDLRRLVVPVTYFIEHPFQNWTRTSADILGTVFIYVDYAVPVERVREQLRHILENSPHWDGKVCVLQVTNATERTVELRALMSAADASVAWTLRCEVREKLIEFVQKHYSRTLPKLRIELEKETG